MATNGNDDTKVAQLTVDVIKKNGLDTAEGIRDLAKRAREEGEAMAQFAEEAAQEIIAMSERAANRIGGYIDRNIAARTDVQKHKDALTDLPENRLNPYAAVQAQADQSWMMRGMLGDKAPESLAAVENALATLKGTDKH